MKGHNGYFGCFHCQVEGERLDGRVVYPTPRTLQERIQQLQLRDYRDIKQQALMVSFHI